MLVDHQIRKLAEDHALVTPYDPALVGPCSLDIRIGDHVLVDAGARWRKQTISCAQVYFLRPGELVLAETLEYFHFPSQLLAQLHLRSTIARMGYGHLLAGFVDAGYAGRLTLEIVNHRRDIALPLYPGMRFAQLAFTMLRSAPAVPYSARGHYFGDTTVQSAKKEAAT